MKSGKVGQVMSKYSIFFVLLVMILISMLLNENFLSTRNITNIAVQLSVATILAYGEMVLIGGIMEHIEQAGVHSGDSACFRSVHTRAQETWLWR